MKNLISLSLVLFAALGSATNAFALQSSKPGTQNRIICRDKLGAKHVSKAEWKGEYMKCLGDPTGY